MGPISPHHLSTPSTQVVETDLVFRGIDADECTAFVREVHKHAQREGKIRDCDWMADLATPAFDGPALIWFGRQSLEVQTDWSLLRRALLEHYCDTRDPSAPSTTTTNATPAIPAPAISPSPRLNLIRDSDRPKFRVRVLAPAYSGYISAALASTQIGNVVTLTSNPGEAQEYIEEHRLITYYLSEHFPLHTTNTIKDSRYEWLCATRSRSDNLCYRLTFGQYNVGQGHSLVGEPRSHNAADLIHYWKTNREGKLTLHNLADSKFTIAKLQDDALTLNLWSQRVWEEHDGAYVAELYLVRAI